MIGNLDNAPGPVIALRGLRKAYVTRRGEVVALDGIDLDVAPGETHGVVGRSGAGKSTLIRCLSLLERPTAGRVSLDGEDVTDLPERRLRHARRRIGMVFQQVDLFDSRTALGNVAYPLEVARVPRAERRRRAAELLGLVGLADRAGAYPAQLSGGQRQRVGIARALAAEPPILLCDEPTSALDAATTGEVLGTIADLRDRLGITVVVVTHEMAVVRAICDSVTLLETGRVAEQGPIGAVLSARGSRLARDLIADTAVEPPAGQVAVEVAYGSDTTPTAAVLAAVAEVSEDAELVSATVRSVGGTRVGRLQLHVPGPDAALVLKRLRAHGLDAEEVGA